jgi:hypothetical protein
MTRIDVRCAFALVALATCACEAHFGYTPPQLPPVPADTYTAYAETTAIDSAGDAYADTDPSALLTFRSALDGHGDWVEDETYGTVWIPATAEVGADFVPYASAGHWVYDTDYVWVSDYPWGWVAFHYGRWARTAARGWVWIPGRQYADAWVVWRVGDEDDFDYVGWAPAPPVWVWRWGVAFAIGAPPAPVYVFCRREEVFDAHPATRIVRGEPVGIEGRTHDYGAAFRPDIRHPYALQPPHGPPPASIRIPPSAVPRVRGPEPGLQAARLLARPETAQAAGARAPTPHFVQPAPARRPLQGVTAPQPVPVPPPAPRSLPRSAPTITTPGRRAR